MTGRGRGRLESKGVWARPGRGREWVENMAGRARARVGVKTGRGRTDSGRRRTVGRRMVRGKDI